MAIPSSLFATETVTFEEAISLTQSFLSEVEAGTLSESEIETVLTSLVKTENGARGFFVTFLTDHRPLADTPSAAVLLALQTSPEIVAPLLVKNLVMSSAMVIHHGRGGNQEMAASSARVRLRSAYLIKQLKGPGLQAQIQEMLASLTTGEGSYQEFLQRWGYDQGQRQVMREALEDVIG